MVARIPAAQRVAEVQWSPYAECLTKDCGWAIPMQRNARNLAKDHAKYKNHKTRIIQETVAVYCRNDYDKSNDKDEEDGLDT
jgi:hypothetical protein